MGLLAAFRDGHGQVYSCEIILPFSDDEFNKRCSKFRIAVKFSAEQVWTITDSVASVVIQ